MSLVIGWLITALVVVLLVAFVAYIVGLRALPTSERPITPTYDRFGQPIGMRENPDYHENPGEDTEDDAGENAPAPPRVERDRDRA